MASLEDQGQLDLVDLMDRGDHLARADNKEGLDYRDQVVSGVQLERGVLREKQVRLDPQGREEALDLQVCNCF